MTLFIVMMMLITFFIQIKNLYIKGKECDAKWNKKEKMKKIIMMMIAFFIYVKNIHIQEKGWNVEPKKTNDKVTKASKYLLGRVKQITKKL